MAEQAKPTLAVVDNTNPDNMFQVLTLMSPHTDLLGVVVTGRAAADSRDACLRDVSPVESEFRTILNAVRMRNFMDAAKPGHDVPVFAGNWAPETLVPHSVHVDELDFGDLYDGQLETIRWAKLRRLNTLGCLGLSGNLKRAAAYLASDEVSEFAMVVGGPMTDVAKLLQHGAVREKTTEVHTQFGMCGFGERKLMEFGDTPRGKRQFNVACDVRAAHRVLTKFPGDIHLYPSDVTRVDAIGFNGAGELAAALPDNRATRRMVEIYDFAFREMIAPRGPHEKIWLHDAAPAIGYLDMPQHRRAATGRAVEQVRGPYTERPVHIRHVPHREKERKQFGEIWLSFIEDPTEIPDTHRRYVADSVDPAKYRQAIHDLTA